MNKRRFFHPNGTKVIFFDLEYYVPRNDRERFSPSGMKFSPVRAGHKILGGTFLTYYPLLDKVENRCNLWEWKQGKESVVIDAIFDFLKFEYKSYKKEDQAGSPVLSGIGISHSDIPALVSKIHTKPENKQSVLYDLLSGCRQVDLSVATFCQFSFKKGYFAYPKKKMELYQKYLAGKKMDPGQSVWELYEQQRYEQIEERCNAEVDDALEIYKAMFDLKKTQDASLTRLKRIDKDSEGEVAI